MKFAYIFLALIVVMAALTAALFAYVSGNTVTTGYSGFILKVEKTSSFFFVSFTLMAAIVLVGVGATGMVVFILFSHRIAGPLFRFEKTLKEVRSGDLTQRINLRKTDQLKEFKNALNELIGMLDERIGGIKNGLDELKKIVSRKNDPESSSKIDGLVDRLKRESERFKVTSGHKE